jgi:hypothetical protein
MSVPLNPKFDRYAQMSYGLVAYGYGPVAKANYLALVTGFMYGDNWTHCYDSVSTTWTACGATVTTTWTDAYTLPVTAWTLLPLGG